MEDLKTPISKVALALKLRDEGMGLRATARVLGSQDMLTLSLEAILLMRKAA